MGVKERRRRLSEEGETRELMFSCGGVGRFRPGSMSPAELEAEALQALFGRRESSGRTRETFLYIQGGGERAY